MVLQRSHYTFSIRLDAPIDWTYEWATDYRPDDVQISGHSGARTVEWLAENLVLLTDDFASPPFDPAAGAPGVKARLVHLYPERHAWVSNHVSGPALHSQFLYELSPRDARSSTFRFTGSQVEAVREPPSRAAIAARSAALRDGDLQLWKNFAALLRADYRSRPKSSTRKKRRG